MPIYYHYSSIYGGNLELISSLNVTPEFIENSMSVNIDNTTLTHPEGKMFLSQEIHIFYHSNIDSEYQYFKLII
jgi:hypothetical protein